MKKIGFIVVCLVVLGSSCAFTPQSVSLSPDIQTTPDSVVSGKQVMLTVVDERPRKSLGTRGVKGVGADLTIEGDLSDVVRKALTDGLTQRGFTITPNKPADGRELRVEIRNLDYNVTMGFWTGSLKVDSTLKGICIIGSTRQYENVYRGDYQENVMAVQTSGANEKYINKVISQAINELLRDQQLIQCLAK
jgi:uncharacterized lipoprotein YajG